MKINQKGFTLIEMLLVMAILGILMGAIVPKLVGTMSRSRDSKRIGDLHELSLVFENFYNENGRYPGVTANTGYCLEDEAIEGADLSQYLKMSKMIKPERASDTLAHTSSEINCTGSYYYKPLTANGVERAGFMIMSIAENEANGNATFVDIDDTAGVTSSVTLNSIESLIGETGDVYVVTSQ